MGSTPIGYSASRVSTLIGLNPYATPLAAFQILKEEQEPGWNLAHGYTLPPAPDNAAIRWGLAFEDAVIKLAEEREQCEVINRENLAVQFIDRGLSLSCHIDGQFSSGFNAHPVLHEGKTTNHWAYTSTKKEIVEALGHDGILANGFSIVRRWGDPGTDEVPQEYQIQAAVQRICTGAELVKLSVLVFPKAQSDYEDMGIELVQNAGGEWWMRYPDKGIVNYDPMIWASVLRDMGNFHTYLLPSNPSLEQAIIESVQKFHTAHMIPGIPPDPTDFDDVRRLLPNPIGTVLATPELVTLCKECGENARQLGSASPLKKRQENVKVEIMTIANSLRRSDPVVPADKMLIINPNGGDVIGTLNKNVNGVISFRAQRAR